MFRKKDRNLKASRGRVQFSDECGCVCDAQSRIDARIDSQRLASLSYGARPLS